MVWEHHWRKQERCMQHSCRIQPLFDNDQVWHWQALIPHSLALFFFLASDTRVVWQNLKIKHLVLCCGQFLCASAVWGGGRGGWRQARLSLLHHLQQGQTELLWEQSCCHPEHVAPCKRRSPLRSKSPERSKRGWGITPTDSGSRFS